MAKNSSITLGRISSPTPAHAMTGGAPTAKTGGANTQHSNLIKNQTSDPNKVDNKKNSGWIIANVFAIGSLFSVFTAMALWLFWSGAGLTSLVFGLSIFGLSIIPLLITVAMFWRPDITFERKQRFLTLGTLSSAILVWLGIWAIIMYSGVPGVAAGTSIFGLMAKNVIVLGSAIPPMGWVLIGLFIISALGIIVTQIVRDIQLEPLAKKEVVLRKEQAKQEETLGVVKYSAPERVSSPTPAHAMTAGVPTAMLAAIESQVIDIADSMLTYCVRYGTVIGKIEDRIIPPSTSADSPAVILGIVGFTALFTALNTAQKLEKRVRRQKEKFDHLLKILLQTITEEIRNTQDKNALLIRYNNYFRASEFPLELKAIGNSWTLDFLEDFKPLEKSQGIRFWNIGAFLLNRLHMSAVYFSLIWFAAAAITHNYAVIGAIWGASLTVNLIVGFGIPLALSLCLPVCNKVQNYLLHKYPEVFDNWLGKSLTKQFPTTQKNKFSRYCFLFLNSTIGIRALFSILVYLPIMLVWNYLLAPILSRLRSMWAGDGEASYTAIDTSVDTEKNKQTHLDTETMVALTKIIDKTLISLTIDNLSNPPKEAKRSAAKKTLKKSLEDHTWLRAGSAIARIISEFIRVTGWFQRLAWFALATMSLFMTASVFPGVTMNSHNYPVLFYLGITALFVAAVFMIHELYDSFINKKKDKDTHKDHIVDLAVNLEISAPEGKIITENEILKKAEIALKEKINQIGLHLWKNVTDEKEPEQNKAKKQLGELFNFDQLPSMLLEGGLLNSEIEAQLEKEGLRFAHIYLLKKDDTLEHVYISDGEAQQRKTLNFNNEPKANKQKLFNMLRELPAQNQPENKETELATKTLPPYLAAAISLHTDHTRLKLKKTDFPIIPGTGAITLLCVAGILTTLMLKKIILLPLWAWGLTIGISSALAFALCCYNLYLLHKDKKPNDPWKIFKKIIKRSHILLNRGTGGIYMLRLILVAGTPTVFIFKGTLTATLTLIVLFMAGVLWGSYKAYQYHRSQAEMRKKENLTRLKTATDKVVLFDNYLPVSRKRIETNLRVSLEKNRSPRFFDQSSPPKAKESPKKHSQTP